MVSLVIFFCWVISIIFFFNYKKKYAGRINFDAFSEIAGHFLEEEDDEAMLQELKEAFRLYDREGR